jgi:hypothetical protein
MPLLAALKWGSDHIGGVVSGGVLERSLRADSGSECVGEVTPGQNSTQFFTQNTNIDFKDWEDA